MRNHRLRAVQKGSVFTGEIGGWPSSSVMAYKNDIMKRPLEASSSSTFVYTIPISTGSYGLFLYLKETPFTGNKQVYVTVTNATTSSIIEQFNYNHDSTYNSNGYYFYWSYPSGVGNNAIIEIKVRLQSHSGPVVYTGYFKVQNRYATEGYLSELGGLLTFINATNQVVWFFGELVDNENANKREVAIGCDSIFCGDPTYPDAIFTQYDLYYFLNGYEQYIVSSGSSQFAYCDDAFWLC